VLYAGAVHACVVRACASHARVAYTCCACPCYACPRCASSCSVWCACAALTASALARLTTRRTGKPLDSGSGGGVNSLRQTCTASPCAAVALLLTASSSQELLVDCDFSLAKTTRQLCFFSKGLMNDLTGMPYILCPQGGIPPICRSSNFEIKWVYPPRVATRDFLKTL
jgi:hypothetical protein